MTVPTKVFFRSTAGRRKEEEEEETTYRAAGLREIATSGETYPVKGYARIPVRRDMRSVRIYEQ